jgi:hypothetical protein
VKLQASLPRSPNSQDDSLAKHETAKHALVIERAPALTRLCLLKIPGCWFLPAEFWSPEMVMTAFAPHVQTRLRRLPSFYTTENFRVY